MLNKEQEQTLENIDDIFIYADEIINFFSDSIDTIDSKDNQYLLELLVLVEKFIEDISVSLEVMTDKYNNYIEKGGKNINRDIAKEALYLVMIMDQCRKELLKELENV